MVLGDVAVRHPATRVRDVEQDVDGLAGADEDGVLPDEVGLRDAVAGEDDEAAGAVDVERVVHRMVRVHLVDEPELDAVADRELPVDPVVGRAGVAVDEHPAHVRGRRQAVDLDHVVLPLDPAGVVPVLVVVVAVSRSLLVRRRAPASCSCASCPCP